MHEINSDSGIIRDHTSTISAAAQELCDGSSLTEDTSTSLAVNSNSTDLYRSIQRAFWLGLPYELRELLKKSGLELTKDDFRATDDGFVICLKSMEEIMNGVNIPKGEDIDPSLYDDWYMVGLVGKDNVVTYTMIKMREPGDKQENGRGSAVPFVSLNIQSFSSAVVNGDYRNLHDELYKVTNADRKSTVNEALKNYFADPKSDGSYLIADCFVEKVANNCFKWDAAEGVYVLRPDNAFKVNDKWARAQLDSLSKLGIYDKETNTIRIKDPNKLTANEYNAILTVTTGNIDAYSFAAENQWHAENTSILKNHTITSDAGVGESKWGFLYEGSFKSTTGGTYTQQKENHPDWKPGQYS